MSTLRFQSSAKYVRVWEYIPDYVDFGFFKTFSSCVVNYKDNVFTGSIFELSLSWTKFRCIQCLGLLINSSKPIPI